MTSTLKVSLSEAVSNRRRGGDLRVVLGPKTVGSTSGFMGVLTLDPGEFVSEHYHPYSEEFVYVVAGRLEVRIDGTAIDVAAEDGVFVPIGARHRIENRSDATASAVFTLGPLAPNPALGHVDTEDLPHPDAPHPEFDPAVAR